ncbi:DUF4340 domain-containing protein [uncultured Merdimonas sp.]|uniref:DUF4340 domain-containing protein n=1 Tax=uncultured Merdimonas sp. TaxID=2023269 RepID=UPI003208C4EC
MKERKMLILLAAAFVALIGCYVGIEVWNEEQKEAADAKAEAEKIFLTDAEELKEISCTSGDQSLGFVKRDGEWYYDEDSQIPVNQDAVDGLADAVTGLTAVRELKDPDEAADYGLEEPSSTIRYQTEKGKTAYIYIGDQTGENYYARTDDSDSIYTISDDLPYRMDYDLGEYVQNDSVPSISSGNLKKVEVTGNGTSVTYEEEDALTELAGGFGTLSLTSPVVFHAEAEDLVDYGLDEASRESAAATYQDTQTGEKETFTVYFGDTDEDGNRYAMVKGSVLVYTVSQSVADNCLTVEETDDADDVNAADDADDAENTEEGAEE